MGLYVGNQRYTPIIRSDTQIYRGSFNIVTDLGLTIDATEQQIAIALATEILNAGIANYCFVDVPFEYYTEVSGYDSFSSTSDYVGYYVVYNDVYILVTNDNKDSVGITTGTTIAYNINYKDYFKYIYRFKYNGNAWVYEYDTDFSGCANVDADNFTSEGETYLSKIGYMDFSRMENLPIPASGTTITAPANGWLWGCTYNTNTQIAVVIFERTDQFSYGLRVGTYTDSNGRRAFALLPLKQGEEVTVYWSTTSHHPALVFIYAEGTPTPSQP